MLKRHISSLKTRKKKGQSTIEYILLVAGVIAVMLYFLGPTGPFATAYNATMTQGTAGMENIATRLSDTHAPVPTEAQAEYEAGN